MALRFRHALVALVVSGSLGLPVIAAPAVDVPAVAPANRVTPPESAMTLLMETLKEHGRKTGFDADYGATNRVLLARLADAIDMVENSPRPAKQGDRIGPMLTTWRTMNRDFVQQLAHDTATLKNLSEQPIRHRLAEQSLYELIVVALRKNVACLRDMAGEWTSQAGAAG